MYAGAAYVFLLFFKGNFGVFTDGISQLFGYLGCIVEKLLGRHTAYQSDSFTRLQEGNYKEQLLSKFYRRGKFQVKLNPPQGNRHWARALRCRLCYLFLHEELANDIRTRHRSTRRINTQLDDALA